jgi:hypothetical protein
MAAKAHADDPVACEMACQLFDALGHIATLEARLAAAEAAQAKADALRDASAELATFKASEVRDWMLQVLLTAAAAYRTAREEVEP